MVHILIGSYFPDVENCISQPETKISQIFQRLDTALVRMGDVIFTLCSTKSSKYLGGTLGRHQRYSSHS